ncbi:MAG: hypothetical protein IKM20_00385 [Erysipelotrichales bacterium]|nr:hypothetical protein [Erysipelotrichales bacterium]
MRELFYYKEGLALINYTKFYPTTSDEILSSDAMKDLIKVYIRSIENKNKELYKYLVPEGKLEPAVKEIIHLGKALCIFRLNEIDSPYLKTDKDIALFQHFVEELYNFWRHTSRYALVSTRTSTGLQLANFIEADQRFNQSILEVYRTIEEKLQGKKNRIYRQLNAGTNACIVTREVDWAIPNGYETLKGIPFIDSLMMRTPLILHTKCNKRYGSFEEVYDNPFKTLDLNRNQWLCFPAKIGNLIAFIYFNRDFISSGISLGNLFEMATTEEYAGRRPDLICLFGVEDGKQDTTFYYDENTNMYIGYLSYDQKIEYFGYMKKIALTLHNLEKMSQGALPIHGSMVDITLKNGTKKGVMFIGDSGAGKSETIEALRLVGEDYIEQMDIVFDDMGSLTVTDEKIYAQGTETGAFVRLDDLEKGTAYRDMDRSIFMNPENNNARVIIPATTYENVIREHKVDMIMYANNYDDKYGLGRFDNLAEAKRTFVEGKRCALGTTHESGITTTYFANPFGPMQKQDICDKLLDTAFNRLFEEDIFVGEIYTRLGVKDDSKDGIKQAATALLELLTKQ